MANAYEVLYGEKQYNTSIDDLWMSDAEICKRYLAGKCKGEMVLILGQMCLCKRDVIINVLKRNGITVDLSAADWKVKRGRPKKFTEEEQHRKDIEYKRNYYRRKKAEKENLQKC